MTTLAGDTAPSVLVERAIAGVFDAEVQAWISAALQAHQRADGAVPLERCLRLPKGADKVRMAQRDRALRRAARLLPRETPRATCVALEEEWRNFAAGWMWRAWRDDAEPPAGTAQLHRELFFACRYHRSSALSTLGARHLERIVFGADDEV